jgi:3-methyl-2-oxobutanoate hydroxymethyltransferase
VIGHIGLTPQSSGLLGGHKAQGRTAEAAKLVVEDAIAVQKAGAKMLLVEGVPPEVTKVIWETFTIPVLSIGAGPHCDGQLLIVSDLIGQFQAFTPKFVKKYCNVAQVITNAMAEYVKEVKAVTFPDEDKYCYHMVELAKRKIPGPYEEEEIAQNKEAKIPAPVQGAGAVSLI